MPIPTPTIIQGPAIATFKGVAIYFRESITAGPSVHLTPAQITNVLTSFSASQTALDGALAQMLTNAP